MCVLFESVPGGGGGGGGDEEVGGGRVYGGGTHEAEEDQPHLGSGRAGHLVNLEKAVPTHYLRRITASARPPGTTIAPGRRAGARQATKPTHDFVRASASGPPRAEDGGGPSAAYGPPSPRGRGGRGGVGEGGGKGRTESGVESS